MKKLNKIVIVSLLAITLIISSTTVFAKILTNNTSVSNSDLTTKQIREKEEVAVDKMLSSVNADIISTFNIDKNLYVNLELKDIPDFYQGKFRDFNDISFCQKVISIRDKEIDSVPFDSFKPTILINKKEFLLLYKDKNGKNFIKKYVLKGDNFEKVTDTSKNGKVISLEQFN